MSGKTLVKFCGMRCEEDISAANGLCPDFIGFILSKPFWRYIEPQKAAELKKLLKPGIKAVGVIVDEPLSYAADLLNKGAADIIQLHGKEDNEYIRSLKALVPGAKVIKAFRVSSANDITEAEKSEADLVLLDGGTGTGESFDHSLIKTVNRSYILAGGLNPENIGSAVSGLKPYGVDVSSGIETDRKKDVSKMRAFIKELRAAEQKI